MRLNESGYSLEGILKIRSDAEEAKLNEMSIKLHKYNEQVSRQKELETLIIETELKLGSVKDITQHNRYYMYLESLRLQLQKQKLEVVRHQRVYDKSKDEYIKAQMDRKVIEKHKERYLEEKNEILKKKEENLLGEFAIMSFARRKLAAE